MALTDKNIVITPNNGQASDPQIVFSGADASTGPQNITVRMYPTSGGTLSWEGSAGQLFSITNSLTGSIYSVNDVSGIPSIEVFDTGVVRLAQYSGNVLLGTATDNTTDKLQVNGSITSTVLKASIATGTAPLVVASTTAVTNLNADLLDGNHASAFYLATNPSGYTTNTGTVTSVGGTGTVSGLTLSGTVTTSGNLTLGGTLSVAASNFSSQTANTFLAAPNGSAGTPTFRTILAADVPTLNQNTTGNAGTVTNGVYTNTTQTITGIKTFSNGLITGDTQGYPDYQFILDTGADVAGTWCKLVTVSSPTGQYQTIGFKIEITDPQSNHATTNSVNTIKEEVYYVACVRTNDVTQDTPDACYVTGPSNRIRAIKTSVGNYEIQIQNEGQYREYRGIISVYAVNGAHTVTYSNGTAVGTATATYTATVNNATTWVQRLGAKGQIISDVATGTAPFTVASTTRVSNLNVATAGNADTVTNGVYTSGSYADPAWITSLAKSKVGLGNVENTALSTWAGSTNITSIGATTATSLAASGLVRTTSATHSVQLGTDAGGSISIGRVDNVASAPYIDFNSGATSTDFDVRLAATGGNGTAGNGTLTLSGNLSISRNLSVSGGLTLLQTSIAASTATTNIDLNLANNFYITLSANTTFTLSNISSKIGSSGIIVLKQDATGGRTFTKATEMKTPIGGAAIAQTTTANSLSMLSYYVADSSNVLINYMGNFA